MNTDTTTKVVTAPVRLAFAHLFEPYASLPNQDPRYSVTLMIPKSDRATLKAIATAQQAALEAGKSTKFGGKIPPNWSNTLHDGDTEQDLEKYPEFAGFMYMAIASPTPPAVVDRALRPILNSTEVYSGCWARVSMNAFPFNTNGNKGVSFGLDNVQKYKDDSAFSGRSRPEDDFTALGDDEEDELM